MTLILLLNPSSRLVCSGNWQGARVPRSYSFSFPAEALNARGPEPAQADDDVARDAGEHHGIGLAPGRTESAAQRGPQRQAARRQHREAADLAQVPPPVAAEVIARPDRAEGDGDGRERQ